ncbi:MAG TPA: dihydrofolate reductase [Planctomycetaceae bacterium]|nr:dihydrofolate reductase [Planctomycetaceae bacterium]|tara:strand:+ start:98 stop:568 length:471 start_codon:yes stop_codon:yes gene_type:complete
MIIISAMSTDRVIGSGDGMPWDVPEEYAQYLRFVTGQTVIMGRVSFEIFGADLPPGTTSIVISRNDQIASDHVVRSLDDALSIAAQTGRTVFVAGGSSIYAEAIPRASEMFLSIIKGDSFAGDTYFPEFDPADWSIEEERDEPRFVFRRYVRVQET